MYETSKANKRRIYSPLFQTAFRGNGIEFGPGDDALDKHKFFPAIKSLEYCDADKDAETIVLTKQYDFIYSSHCLEHLKDPAAALQRWYEALKPYGYLVLLLPDEDLYEQGHWPSIFSTSHKWTFTIQKDRSWSPVSINVVDILRPLPDHRVIKLEVIDTNYNYSLKDVDQLSGNAEAAIEIVVQKTEERP